MNRSETRRNRPGRQTPIELERLEGRDLQSALGGLGSPQSSILGSACKKGPSDFLHAPAKANTNQYHTSLWHGAVPQSEFLKIEFPT
jgi:hypothetical protein